MPPSAFVCAAYLRTQTAARRPDSAARATRRLPANEDSAARWTPAGETDPARAWTLGADAWPESLAVGSSVLSILRTREVSGGEGGLEVWWLSDCGCCWIDVNSALLTYNQSN